jgi:8-oxo-dGTP pyrophosphatase MutT (NUDIX family)
MNSALNPSSLQPHIPPGLHVCTNAYGDLQLVGDITSVDFSEAAAFIKAYGESARRGAWLQIPFTTEGVRLLAFAQSVGFTLAHSVRDNIITLQCWRQDGMNPTPAGPITDCGACALVIDSRGRLLCIRERFDKSGKWHCPGGHVDAGEDFVTAAVREAWEETGVKCSALGVVGTHHLTLPLVPLQLDSAQVSPERRALAEQSCRFGCLHHGVYVLCFAVGEEEEGGGAVALSADAAEISECR